MKRIAILFAFMAICAMAMAQAEIHNPNDPNFIVKCKTGQYLRYTITSKESPCTVTLNGIKGDTENVKKIEIPATVHSRNTDFVVTAINKGAFSGITTLTSVTIPQTVKTIKADAFKDCSALKSIKFGGTIEHCGENAFAGTAINKPIYTGNNLVYYPACMSEYKINEGTEAILEYAFGTCNEMTSITIPTSVKTVYTTSFANCVKLTSIIISEGNKTYDSRNNCNAIVLTAENKIIGGCINSTIPNGITSVGKSAFANVHIQKIDIPNSITTIEDSAFYNCELTSVTIPESVKEIGASAFNRNKKLAVVNFNAINSKTNKDFPAFTQCMSLISVNFGENVAIVPAFSFMNCEELRYATLSNSIKEIGEKAFFGCKMLSYLDLPNSVEKIGEKAFYESGISEPIHSEYLFAYFPPNYATEYSIPEGIKTIAQWAFIYAGELKSLILPNSVTKIEEESFCDCKLENIVLSDSLEFIGYKAFSYCTQLNSITLPKSLKTIDKNAFMGCFKLEHVIIPDSITEINDLVFYDTGLKTITIPKSVKSIKESAFNQCLDLKYIYIPKGTMTQFKNMLNTKFHSKLKEK